ncbi:MAG: hypothetical protein ACI83D_000077 [Planctomycetota bacterium]|jgi:hypothetical protein
MEESVAYSNVLGPKFIDNPITEQYRVLLLINSLGKLYDEK